MTQTCLEHVHVHMLILRAYRSAVTVGHPPSRVDDLPRHLMQHHTCIAPGCALLASTNQVYYYTNNKRQSLWAITHAIIRP